MEAGITADSLAGAIVGVQASKGTEQLVEVERAMMAFLGLAR